VSVQVTIPTVFRIHTGGSKSVFADGATLAEVLTDLADRHPGLRGRVLNDDGTLRRFINFYINDVDVRFTGLLGSRVADGDAVLILPAVAGG
jgi:molybdopterin converting factor small subunit